MMGAIMATICRRMMVKDNEWDKFYWLMYKADIDVATRAAMLHIAEPDFAERRLKQAEEDLTSRLTKVST